MARGAGCRGAGGVHREFTGLDAGYEGMLMHPLRPAASTPLRVTHVTRMSHGSRGRFEEGPGLRNVSLLCPQVPDSDPKHVTVPELRVR